MIPQLINHQTAHDCEIPVVVNLSLMPQDLADEFSRAFDDATKFWNNQGLNFSFIPKGQVDSEFQMGAITIKWSHGNSHVGYTVLSKWNVQGLSVAARAVVEMYADQSWCRDGQNLGCLRLADTIAHELGHAVGLDHNSRKSSIMYAEVGDWQPMSWYVDEDDRRELLDLFPPSGNRCVSDGEKALWLGTEIDGISSL